MDSAAESILHRRQTGWQGGRNGVVGYKDEEGKAGGGTVQLRGYTGGGVKGN